MSYLLGPKMSEQVCELAKQCGDGTSSPREGGGETRWDATAILGTRGDGGGWGVIADGVYRGRGRNKYKQDVLSSYDWKKGVLSGERRKSGWGSGLEPGRWGGALICRDKQGVSVLFSRKGRGQGSMWRALDGCRVCRWTEAIPLGVKCQASVPRTPRGNLPAVQPALSEHGQMP